MAINKNFVVKNGLEVNTDLIFADANTNKVGIASTAPRTTLDVRGGIAATDINIAGVATINALQVTDINVSGIATFADISIDEISARNLNLTGIATIPVGIVTNLQVENINATGVSTIPVILGITTIADIDSTNINVSGVSTIATVDINAGDIEVTSVRTSNLNATGVSTIASLSVTGSTFERLTVTDYSNLAGITTIDNAIVTNLNVTGVSTLGTVQVSSGIITATSGIVTYYGDGAYLQNISAGIGIGTTGGLVGYAVTFINFYGTGVSTALYDSNVGIATIFFEGGGSGSISISTIAPTSPSSGDLWYSPDYGRTFIYYDEAAVGYGTDAYWVDAAPFNAGIITSLTNVAFSPGSANSPSIYFVGDSQTGFFSPTTGEITFVSAGSSILNINASGLDVTGVVTATSFVGDGSNLTGIDATSLKDSGGNVKVQANPNGIVITGVATATSFSGSGANLTNLPAGLGTALSSDKSTLLGNVYYQDQRFSIGSTVTINVPDTAIVGYTPYAEIEITGDADLIVSDGDEFVVDVLGIGTTAFQSSNSTGGKVRADQYSNASGTGAPTFNNGLNISGVVTSTSGFISAVGTTAVQITLSGNSLIFTAAGIGSTSFTLF